MNKYLEKVAEDGFFTKYKKHLTGEYEKPHREKVKYLRDQRNAAVSRMNQAQDIVKQIESNPHYHAQTKKMQDVVHGFNSMISEIDTHMKPAKHDLAGARLKKFVIRGGTIAGLGTAALVGHALYNHGKTEHE